MDYPLFAMDIRENAKARVEAYIKDQLSDGPAP